LARIEGGISAGAPSAVATRDVADERSVGGGNRRLAGREGAVETVGRAVALATSGSEIASGAELALSNPRENCCDNWPPGREESPLVAMGRGFAFPGANPIVGKRSGGGSRLAPANEVDGGAWKTISESTGREVTRELLGFTPVTADAWFTLRRWNRENQLDNVPDRGSFSVAAMRLLSC
jgi:hypothetical protein